MIALSTSRQDIPIQRVAAIRTRRVVVGVDGSYWSRIALRWAAEYSALADAELAVYAPPPDVGCDLSGMDDVFRALPVPPAAVQAEEDVATALMAASRLADLVVLGCRGRDQHGIGLGGAVLPVATGAGCDVAVIGGRPETALGGRRSISVQVGTDGDAFALRSAARLAALRQVPLRIVLPVRRGLACPTDDPVDRYLAVLAGAADLVSAIEPAVRIATDLLWIRGTDPVPVSAGADVLVIGVAEGLTRVARAALYHAHCPVLVTRRPVPHRRTRDA